MEADVRSSTPNTFKKLFRPATAQLVEVTRQFAEYWRQEKLKVNTRSQTVDLRKKVVLDMSRSVTSILCLRCLATTFLATDTQLISTFVYKNLGDVQD